MVMDKIPLKEYAEKHGIAPVTARQRAQRGSYKTAEKKGRDWFISPDEPHTDNRIKTGEFKNWRNKTTS
jgi:hypothetical protein